MKLNKIKNVLSPVFNYFALLNKLEDDTLTLDECVTIERIINNELIIINEQVLPELKKLLME